MPESIESWAGNIADIGAIYPFAGNEQLFFVIVLVFWLTWHIINITTEDKQWQEELDRFGDKPLPTKDPLKNDVE